MEQSEWKQSLWGQLGSTSQTGQPSLSQAKLTSQNHLLRMAHHPNSPIGAWIVHAFSYQPPGRFHPTFSPINQLSL